MGSTTFSGPVTSTNGFVGTITGQQVGAAMAEGAGTGVTAGVGTVVNPKVFKNGNVITTQIFIDVTGLDSNVLDDIIGVAGGAANCNFGQITVAESGALFAGQVTCLEVPTGGEPDIDFYGATVGTGAEDTDIEDLDEQLLLASAADWTLHRVAAMTTVPRADDWLYLVNGGSTTDDTYTAGQFMIELYGYAV
jgi:hypothetical protein